MASSLLMLLDDIATVLDDVALLTKIATKKTAGVLGDDLALNAQQIAGVAADRELPVVWAVAKGSLLNKAILVPSALAISALAPWAVIPLLMIGGAYLCYEGFEKLAHKFLHSKAEEIAHHAELIQALADPAVDLVAFEKDKIKGAVRTDFILSAEIIVITLGTVAEAPFMTQVAVLTGIALIMTAGVYGLVAGIVKLDDGGLHLSQRTGETAFARMQRSIGAGILKAAPWLMKGLSIAGTAAMFLVGGGILVHGIPAMHHWIEGLGNGMATVPGAGDVLNWTVPLLLDAVIGIVAGALVLAVVSGAQRVLRSRTAAP
jgi:predicted DNA repair protein MutK